MTNPAIQNDFSYYRRTLSRRKMANEVQVFSALMSLVTKTNILSVFQ